MYGGTAQLIGIANPHHRRVRAERIGAPVDRPDDCPIYPRPFVTANSKIDGKGIMDSVAPDCRVGPRPLMLAALDLARGIEAGELTPADVVARCAEAIAAREADVRAF